MIFFENRNSELAKRVSEACSDAGEEVVDVSTFSSLQDALASKGTPRAYVLSPPERCEATALSEALQDPQKALDFGNSLYAEAKSFLSDCRSMTQAMMAEKSGQLLFLGVDDVAARLIGKTQNPIGNQMRVSAFRSLAKEYGRMGIRFNAIISQPSKESVESGVWRQKRDALKVYTMRFSPVEIDEYANFCAQALNQGLPVNGGQICLGKGVMEMSA